MTSLGLPASARRHSYFDGLHVPHRCCADAYAGIERQTSVAVAWQPSILYVDSKVSRCTVPASKVSWESLLEGYAPPTWDAPDARIPAAAIDDSDVRSACVADRLQRRLIMHRTKFALDRNTGRPLVWHMCWILEVITQCRIRWAAWDWPAAAA